MARYRLESDGQLREVTDGAIVVSKRPAPPKDTRYQPGQLLNREEIKAAFVSAKEKVAERYRKHWHELHNYRMDVWDAESAQQWYLDWKKRIPRVCGTCLSDWKKLEQANPPCFDNQGSFLRWGFDRHNNVNERLGKPTFSWVEFVEKYDEPLIAPNLH